MSDSLPRLIVLAIGGSIAPPSLLLTILFLSSQRPLPNASALALGYFTTCAVIGISGLHLFGGAESATVALCFVLGTFFFLRVFLGGLRAWVIVGALQGRH
jgi:hypothetical protein